MRPLVRVGPFPVLGDCDQRLIQKTPVRHGILECDGVLPGGLRRLPAKQGFRRHLAQEGIRGQRLVTQLQRKRQGDR